MSPWQVQRLASLVIVALQSPKQRTIPSLDRNGKALAAALFGHFLDASYEFIFRKEFTCLWRCGWLNKVNPRLQPALISGQDLGMPISASCTLLLRVSIARLLGLGRWCCLLQQVQTPEGPGLPNNKCLCYSVDAVIMAGLCMTVSWLFPWDWLLPLSSLPSHASTADLPKVPFSTTVMLFSS